MCGLLWFRILCLDSYWCGVECHKLMNLFIGPHSIFWTPFHYSRVFTQLPRVLISNVPTVCDRKKARNYRISLLSWHACCIPFTPSEVICVRLPMHDCMRHAAIPKACINHGSHLVVMSSWTSLNTRLKIRSVAVAGVFILTFESSEERIYLIYATP